ncbi:MAG TPA: RpiB/LacA/LacB family sugar-phosphate isomerase, partial [Schlesneria sp.]
RPQATELTAAVITADLLAATVRSGMALQIGRKSIVTPAARDWLHTNKVVWSRNGSVAPQSMVATEPTVKVVSVGKWQLVIQTVTANVRALQDAFKRQSDGWDIELVGQSYEAAAAAVRAISTAERDGVVVISDFAEIIACLANRNARVRAAVITDRKQLELASQHLGVNLVCVNPQGKTFIELRNLLRDCAAMTPTVPADWNQ